MLFHLLCESMIAEELQDLRIQPSVLALNEVSLDCVDEWRAELFWISYLSFTVFGSNAHGAASSFLATVRSVFCSTGESRVVTLLSKANLATSL